MTILHELLHSFEDSAETIPGTRTRAKAKHDLLCYPLVSLRVPSNHFVFRQYPRLLKLFSTPQIEQSSGEDEFYDEQPVLNPARNLKLKCGSDSKCPMNVKALRRNQLNRDSLQYKRKGRPHNE